MRRNIEGPQKITLSQRPNGANFLAPSAAVQWFNTYCTENRLEGAIIPAFEGDQGGGIKMVSATVYINGEVVGKSAAVLDWQEDDPVKDASSRAIGRALANAGFCAEELIQSPLVTESELPQDTLRFCKYDYRGDVVFFAQKDEVTKEEKILPYLLVIHRVKWFNEYLAYTKKDGYIDDSKLTVIGDRLLATANVVIDGKIVATGIASDTLENLKLPQPDGINAYGTLLTKAKGQALLFAGFGLCGGTIDTLDDEINGPLVPYLNPATAPKPDVKIPVASSGPIPPTGMHESVPSGSTMPEMDASSAVSVSVPNKETGSDVAPVPAEVVPPQPKRRGRPPKQKSVEPAPAAVPVSSPMTTTGTEPGPIESTPVSAPAVSAPAPMPVPEMTDEEVNAMVVPVGQYKGKTIGEMWVLNDGKRNIRFYASDAFTNPRYASLKVACRRKIEMEGG